MNVHHLRARALAGLLLASALAVSPSGSATPTRPNGPPSGLLGSWQGRSLCVTTSHPACTDETVLYRITAGASATAFHLAAFKQVQGRTDWMGDLDCRFEATRQQLICPMAGGEWRLRWDGDTLVGALTMEDRTLFRVIQVRRDTTGTRP